MSPSGEGNDRRSGDAIVAWIDALSESQLVGSAEVLNAAQVLDTTLQQRRMSALIRHLEGMAPEGGQVRVEEGELHPVGHVRPQERGQISFEDAASLLRDGKRIKDEQLGELIRACRADIESLGD